MNNPRFENTRAKHYAAVRKASQEHKGGTWGTWATPGWSEVSYWEGGVMLGFDLTEQHHTKPRNLADAVKVEQSRNEGIGTVQLRGYHPDFSAFVDKQRTGEKTLAHQRRAGVTQ